MNAPTDTVGRADSTARPRVLSSGTVGFAVLAVLLVCAYTGVAVSGALSEDAQLWVSDLGSAAVNGLTALAAWSAALSYSRGRTRTVWTLVALGLTTFAVGDAVWSYVQLVLGQDPYPSASDLFYIAEYGFLGGAMVLSATAYRGLVRFRGPAVVSAAVGLAGLAAVYWFLLRPYIMPAGPDELEPLAKAVSVFYPLADVTLLLVPAVFTLAVISQLGTGRFAWAWWLVVVGALAYAVGDSAYSFVDWKGIYGDWFWLVDPTWIVANLTIAVAALVARDAYTV